MDLLGINERVLLLIIISYVTSNAKYTIIRISISFHLCC
jgi:hypothetical protein